ncbi:MAG: hypothetical protein ACI4QL_02080 [Candidatus Fimimonas sp.]
METTKNKVNLPWEDDDVEFLKGDWEIRRADCVGLYRYSISEIEGQRAVDAVQLIQWKMAKVCDYPTLHPWENSDVTFACDCEIIRDPRDQSSPKGKRRYLMEQNGVWCVNKYYLVQHGLATYGAKVQKEVSAVKLGGLDILKMYAWEEDGIIVFPPSGVSINKAQQVGKYRITTGGITSVRSAEFLLQNGYAKRIFDVQLEHLARCEPTTIAQVGKDLHGFWYSRNAETICSLRQIAKLNYQVEQCTAPCVTELLDASIHKQAEMAVISAEINKCIQGYDAVQSQLECAVRNCHNAFNDDVLPFKGVRILDDCSDFDALHTKFCDLCDFAEKQLEQLSAVVAQLNELLAQSKKCVETNVDAKIFPPKVGEVLKKTEEDVQKRLFPLQELQLAATKRIGQAKGYQTVKDGLEKIQKTALEIACEVIEVKERKNQLNQLADQLGDKAKKRKRHLFNRTYKPNGIVLTTALRIRHTGYGKYEVEGKDGGVLAILSAEELVYLHLAKYKRGIK